MLNFNPTILDSIGNYHLLKIQYPNGTVEYALAVYLQGKDQYTQSEFPYQIIQRSDQFLNLPPLAECQQLEQHFQNSVLPTL
jgi:hypothetical protein